MIYAFICCGEATLVHAPTKREATRLFAKKLRAEGWEACAIRGALPYWQVARCVEAI